jgi:hypothetical protein
MRSVLVVLAIAGCYKDKPAVAPPPANKVDAPLSSGSDDVLAFLPVESEIILGIDLLELRASALYRSFEGELSGNLGTRLAEAKQCGVDPMGGLERITAAGTVSADSDKFQGVVVVRGVDASLALPCMAKQAAAKGKVTNEDGVVTITQPDHQDAVATSAGARTLVIQFGPGVGKASIASVKAKGAPLRTSPAFMALFQRREPHAAVWGMINGNAKFMAQVRASGVNPKNMDGTIRVTDQLVAALRVSFATPGDADQLVQTVGQVQGFVKPMLERFEVRADGTVVHIDATATEGQLRALASMMGGAFGP